VLRILKYFILSCFIFMAVFWIQACDVEPPTSEAFIQTATSPPTSGLTATPPQAPITINLEGNDSTNKPSTLAWVTAIGAITTPILVLLLTGVGWFVGHRIQTASKQREEEGERIRQLEERLREDRIEIYNKILEPFIILLTKDEAIEKAKKYQGKTKADIASGIILSIDYRTTAFKQVLMGSDGVVKAFNALMQYSYRQAEKQTSPDIETLTKLLGNFLLEIRRGVGNENTSLDNIEMLEWLITDIKRYRDNKNGDPK